MENPDVQRVILTILEFAIADEKASQEKYKWLALNATRKEFRDMFLTLYGEERQHEKKMQKHLDEMKKEMRTRRSHRKR